MKNLRTSLANRLCEHPADEKTRSIPYRQVVRKVSYQRVDSAAEAQWVYAQFARELFPHAYAKMVDDWRAWYVAIDPAAKFPRYTVTDSPDRNLRQTTFGPLATRSAAQKLVETLEDAFDLCRYYHILTQSPHGQACAYKQMHKCPAPCDGSVSFSAYRQQIDLSIAALCDKQVLARHEARMQQAAGALQFELAGKIKAFVDQLKSLSAGPCEHLRPVSDLRFCAVLRGSKAKSWKLMLLTPQAIELSLEWSKPEEMVPVMERFRKQWEQSVWDHDSADRLIFIARQLLQQNRDAVLTTPELQGIEQAVRELSRRKTQADTDDEGVIQGCNTL